MALVVGDDDLVRLPSRLVSSGDIDDTVSVTVEGDLNLRNTTGCRRKTSKLELAEQVVVLRARTPTLVCLDQYTRLVVGVVEKTSDFYVRIVVLRLMSGFNAERARSDIEEQDFGGSFGSLTSFIGVGRFIRLFFVEEIIEEIRDELDDMGDAGGAANEDDSVDL